MTGLKQKRRLGWDFCVIPHQRDGVWDSWGRKSWGGGPGWPSWCWGDGEHCQPSETAGPPGITTKSYHLHTSPVEWLLHTKIRKNIKEQLFLNFLIKSKSKSSDGAHHCHVVQRASINSSLIKVTFVLRETDVIQPSWKQTACLNQS